MKPLVGLPSDTFDKDGLRFHSIGDKYLRAVHDVARCLPVMIPSLGDSADLITMLDHVDGIVMTGAASNVHPPLFGTEPSPDHEPYDHSRDATTLRLIEETLGRDIPLFCICRGFQELNVALGGTLVTEIQHLPGRSDHRAPDSQDLDVRYGPVHDIRMRPDGELAAILGKDDTRVNTVHRQAIDRLADRLEIEAQAPDGTIEAASVRGARGFALGVQWHPEYKAAGNPDSVALFEAFGDAARRHAKQRLSWRRGTAA